MLYSVYLLIIIYRYMDRCIHTRTHTCIHVNVRPKEALQQAPKTI